MGDATTGVSNSFYSFLLGLLLSQWAMVSENGGRNRDAPLCTCRPTCCTRHARRRSPVADAALPSLLITIPTPAPHLLQVGYDSSAHIAEETKNAAVAGPVGLVTAIIGEPVV